MRNGSHKTGSILVETQPDFGKCEGTCACFFRTDITTDEGAFTYYATASYQTGTRDPNCQDGRGLQASSTVLAIRQ